MATVALFDVTDGFENGVLVFETGFAGSGTPSDGSFETAVDPSHTYLWAATGVLLDGASGGGSFSIRVVDGDTEPSADIDGDGLVGLSDLVAVLAAWGSASGPADLDGDGTVGLGDLLVVLSAWDQNG